MQKTKNEIVNMPEINYYKLKHFNELKAKHPDLRIEFPD